MLYFFQMPINLAAVDIGKEFQLKKGVGIGEEAAGPGYKSFWGFISMLLPNIYVIAGVILFILLFTGGFVIITSAGDPEKQQQGGKAITAAIIGFLIIFVSYWIIQIIEHLTGVKILEPGPIPDIIV